MANMSDLLNVRLRKHFGIACTDTAALLTPLSYKLALFTTDTGLQTGSPTGEVTTVGSAYARQVLVLDTGTTASKLSNPSDILFDTPTANWGTVTYSGVFAEVSTGVYELWWYAQLKDPATNLPSPLNVANNGTRVRFRAGEFILTFA
jgi:hypothetical protein